MYEKVYKNETLKIFTDLLSVPNPTAREELVAAKIMEYADSWGYKSEQDFAGNVVVRVKGNGKSKRVTMTASHIDEIGLVDSLDTAGDYDPHPQMHRAKRGVLSG